MKVICLCAFFTLMLSNNIFVQDLAKINLVINPNKVEITDTLFLKVTVENNSKVPFSILNRQHINTSNNPIVQWKLLVLFEDSIQVASSKNAFYDPVPPSPSEYVRIKRGEKYSFNFFIKFNKLVRKPLDIGKHNEDYGNYTLKLTYKDVFCGSKDALKEKIESNVIHVTYKKE